MTALSAVTACPIRSAWQRLGVSDLARGFGCRAVDVTTAEELEQEFKAALSAEITTVIVVRTQPQKAML